MSELIHRKIQQGRRQEGQEREAQTIGYLWKGEGWGGVHRVNKMYYRDFQEGKQGI